MRNKIIKTLKLITNPYAKAVNLLAHVLNKLDQAYHIVDIEIEVVKNITILEYQIKDFCEFNSPLNKYYNITVDLCSDYEG